MFDGEAVTVVTVVTRVLPDQDAVMAEVTSALAAQGRLGVAVRFPGVSKNLNPDPSDWVNPGAHSTTEVPCTAGVARRADWDAVRANWPELPQKDGLYLPVRFEPDFWDKAAGDCKSNAVKEHCQNRDWDLRQTWGWDYPMMAMTAARLQAPEEAVDWLFFNAKYNQYGSSGMTPRVHLDAHAAAFVPAATGAGTHAGVGPDVPGYQRAAEAYFPSNGGLPLAVALMAGGWDGSRGSAPGFPDTGWKVWVDLSPSL